MISGLLLKQVWRFPPLVLRGHSERANAALFMQRLLPSSMEVPGSFECIGHIAHLNLRDDMLPFKHVIGEVRPNPFQRLRIAVAIMQTIEAIMDAGDHG